MVLKFGRRWRFVAYESSSNYTRFRHAWLRLLSGRAQSKHLWLQCSALNPWKMAFPLPSETRFQLLIVAILRIVRRYEGLRGERSMQFCALWNPLIRLKYIFYGLDSMFRNLNWKEKREVEKWLKRRQSRTTCHKKHLNSLLFISWWMTSDETKCLNSTCNTHSPFARLLGDLSC